MGKHTPGPWFADKAGNIWRRNPSDLYENGGGVAGDKPLASANRGWHHEDSQWYPVEANAKLIAAAPDLLEALIVLSGSHPEVAMASDDELRASIMHCDDPIGVAQAGALLKARAAIKKATE